MRIFWMAVLVWTYASIAHAGTVAVAPVTYSDATTGESLPDVAAKVEAKVVEGVQEAGHEVLFGSVVKAAVTAQAEDGECARECMGRVAEELGAGEVVLVTVEDMDQVSYQITLTFIGVDGIAEEKTDGFYVVLEWLKGTVALSLKDIPASPVAAPEAEASGEAGEGTEADGEELTDMAPASGSEGANTGRKKFGRKPFIISALTTAGLGIVTLVLDGVVQKKYGAMEDRIHLQGDVYNQEFADELSDEIDTINNLQVAEGVFLGLTLAGVVTTGIFAIFTDFKKERAPEASTPVALRPVFGTGKGSAMLGVHGAF